MPIKDETVRVMIEALGLVDCDCPSCTMTKALVARAEAELAGSDEAHRRDQLLLCRLKGEPTNHGDCPVAARLDQLEAELERLAEVVGEEDAEIIKTVLKGLKCSKCGAIYPTPAEALGCCEDDDRDQT